jgi:hypothetical protein
MQTQPLVDAATFNAMTVFLNSSSSAESLAQAVNDLSAVQSAADSAANAAGGVAVAAGLIWNAFQLVLNSKEAHDAGKALKALNLIDAGTFSKAQTYAKTRLKNKQVRRGVQAASSGLGIVAGGVGIAVLAGVAATPAGWALMAAGLMIGVGILGYKIGRYAYKKHHRNNHAADLIIDIGSPIDQIRQDAELYMTQVLGMDVERCRRIIDSGGIGTAKQEIMQRMENKRLVIAVQLLKTLSDEDSPNSDYSGAQQIIEALGLDLAKMKDTSRMEKNKQKIVKALSSW